MEFGVPGVRTTGAGQGAVLPWRHPIPFSTPIPLLRGLPTCGMKD